MNLNPKNWAKSWAIVGLVLLLCYCTQEKLPIDFYPIQLEKVTRLDGLKHPWSICFLDEEEALITEKDGNLLRVNIKNQTRTIIKGFPADLADSIRLKDRRDNSGIFEVVLHPKFKENQLIYLSYAAQKEEGTTTKIVRARLADNQLEDLQDIFVAEPFTSDLFHYGGGMVFGQDGKLYCTIGERLYDEIDQPAIPIAQDVTDKRGKIYRLNDDGTIPADNPDFGENAIPGLYAIGIRAAQGIVSNPKDGSIWFSEHGSFQGDELNLLQAGANYGWPIKTTGKYRNPNYIPPTREGIEFTNPQHYWFQTIAPTGLTFYYGSFFPQWEGNIILAGLSRGSLWSIHLDGKVVIRVEELFVNDRVRARKVAVNPAGKLYILTDEPDGKLLEIRNAGTSIE